MHGLWPVEKCAELADGLTGCGEIAWNFSMRMSTVITGAG